MDNKNYALAALQLAFEWGSGDDKDKLKLAKQLFDFIEKNKAS